jgi:hypothetical protein
MMPSNQANPLSGLMNQQASLVSIIQNALAQQGINAEVHVDGNKAYFKFTQDEVKKMFLKAMPANLANMVTIEQVGEMVFSMKLG